MSVGLDVKRQNWKLHNIKIIPIYFPCVKWGFSFWNRGAYTLFSTPSGGQPHMQEEEAIKVLPHWVSTNVTWEIQRYTYYLYCFHCMTRAWWPALHLWRPAVWVPLPMGLPPVGGAKDGLVQFEFGRGWKWRIWRCRPQLQSIWMIIDRCKTIAVGALYKCICIQVLWLYLLCY